VVSAPRPLRRTSFNVERSDTWHTHANSTYRKYTHNEYDQYPARADNCPRLSSHSLPAAAATTKMRGPVPKRVRHMARLSWKACSRDHASPPAGGR
jgi:hypothetical protein